MRSLSFLCAKFQRLSVWIRPQHQGTAGHWNILKSQKTIFDLFNFAQRQQEPQVKLLYINQRI